MLYSILEEYVGDYLDEPGTKPAGNWVRYAQADRQQAIAWAELLGAKHRPVNDLRMLRTTVTSVTISKPIITVPSGFMRVVDLWCATNGYHYLPLTDEEIKFIDNENYAAGFYYHLNDSGIKIYYPSGLSYDPDVTKPSLIYIKQPTSYLSYSTAATVPFVENEEWIAMGAAAILLVKDNVAKGDKFMSLFLGWLGITKEEAKLNG